MNPLPLSIEMFGGLRIRRGAEPPVEVAGQQTGTLLAYLALYPQRPHTREELATLLWPDDDPTEARTRLRNSLYAVRRLLDGDSAESDSALLTSRSTAQLDPARVSTDLAAFEAAARAASDADSLDQRASLLAEAVQLYRGELLPGIYADFVLVERERVAGIYRGALHALTQAYEAQGKLDQAVDVARRSVTQDPANEEAHCDLMRLYAAQGKPSAVLRQYQELERVLREELGEEPSPTARELMESLREAGRAATAAREPQEVKGRGQEAGAGGRGAGDAVLAPPSRKPRRGSILVFTTACAVVLAVIGAWRLGLFGGRPAPAPAGSFRELWAVRYQGAAGDRDSEPTAIATDPAGCVYTTGFVQTADHDVDFLTVKYDPSGKKLWEARYNGPGNDLDRARSIAVAQDGSVYVTGESMGKTGVKGVRLSELDYAVVKYDASGRQLWADHYDGANGPDVPVRMALVGAGGTDGVVVTGASWNGHRVRGGPDDDFATVRYAPDGRRLWVRRFDSGHSADQARDVTADAAGNVYVTGSSQATAVMGDTSDCITIKYDAFGNEQWMRRWDGEFHGNDSPVRAALSADGSLYVLGETYHGDPAYKGTRIDALLLKYDAEGNLVWHRRLDGDHQEDDRGRDLAVAPDGFVYVAVLSNSPSTFEDFLVACYEPGGALDWIQPYNGRGSRNDVPESVAVTPDGGVVVTGKSFGGEHRFPGATDWDFATLAFAKNGNRLWFQAYNSPFNGGERGIAAAVGPDGAVYVMGQSQGEKTVDMVIVKYGP